MEGIVFIDKITRPDVSELGGKGYSLAVLYRHGFMVPNGFIVTSSVFFAYLKLNSILGPIKSLANNISEENIYINSQKIRTLIQEGEIPPQIYENIDIALETLKASSVSIRSSAVSEDSELSSFAGLHATFLNVETDTECVVDHIKQCWASLFSDRAVLYRFKKNLDQFEGMAVIVQEMIMPDVSGITFTVHPTDRSSMLIEASYGLGDLIVGGKVDPDDYVVDRVTLAIKNKRIGSKSKKSIAGDRYTKIVKVHPNLSNKQSLSDDQVKKIARVCLDIEQIFGRPQDIEWSAEDDHLWILQSRPITGGLKNG